MLYPKPPVVLASGKHGKGYVCSWEGRTRRRGAGPAGEEAGDPQLVGQARPEELYKAVVE